MQNASDSPPRAPPIQYTAPLGTRWAREKAAAGGSAAFDLATDPKSIGPWILGECIGKGASGRVKIARHQRTRQLAAVKILPIAPLVNSRASLATQQAKSEKQRLGIDREITMMKLMNHPNIMRIYDVYEGDKELFLVLEYVEGGELFDFLVNKGRLPPYEALVYFRQIIYGLNYAHTFSIIHRDLKPENILIASLNPPVVKIADWGMAAFAPPSLQLETSCGSPHYASPEIVNGEKYHGTATDIWSCGVILYALLTGRLPFDDKNVRTLLSKVKSGKYDTPSWIDPMAKDLLAKMLVVDVTKRITIPEILNHPWFVKGSATSGIPPPDFIWPATPPLPPSPSILARPIASPNHIDPELLGSLRIIWGRHADSQGIAIQQDLCSPQGSGHHAKAFYFLLDKYREESLRNRSNDVLDAGLQSPRADLACTDHLLLGWDIEQDKRLDAPLTLVVPQGVERQSGLRGASEKEDEPSMEKDASFARQSTDTERTGRKRSTHSYSSSSGTTVTRSAAASMSTISYAHQQHRRPSLSRRGVSQNSTAALSHLEMRRATEPAASSSTMGPPLFSPHHPCPDRPAVLSPPPVYSARIASSAAMDVDTVTPTLPSPRERFVGTMVLAEAESETASDVMPDSGHHYDQHHPHHHHQHRPPTRSRLEAEKENTSATTTVEDGWTHVKVVNGEATGRVFGNALQNQYSNMPTRSRKEKERKARPPPLELATAPQRRNFTGSSVQYGNAAASPFPPGLSHGSSIAGASSATRSNFIQSPVVGEFKGWFSNLFNWKNAASPPSTVFYSTQDLPRTREITLRFFQSLTFGISRVIMDVNSDGREGSEIYHCRLDQAAVDRVGDKEVGTLKPVRLRVEFGLAVPPSPTLLVGASPAATYGENAYSYVAQQQTGGTTALGYPISYRARTSLALGRTTSNTGSVMHTPTHPATPLLSPHWEIPAGCACVVVMTFEKGSTSTFRTVRQRLRDVLADGVVVNTNAGTAAGGGFGMAILSPLPTPNIPGSAFSDGHGRRGA
ncbi:CAMK/CAMKL/GIN4 protein kinase [Coprinopsis sp. MPI-PUGE-AT-0042]|nr:CAMK/CAMKL/GIN4 protein kinase [Coprinopsis sp. MPI-PUGE-AT-0042]